jgi:hypothetical protein
MEGDSLQIVPPRGEPLVVTRSHSRIFRSRPVRLVIRRVNRAAAACLGSSTEHVLRQR